jgi:hypothetical protein
MKKLTQYERGYIEGIIDGEGSIVLVRKKNFGHGAPKRGWSPSITLNIANNNIFLLKKVQKIIGLKTMYSKKGTKSFYLRACHGKIKWLFPQIKLIEKEYRRRLALKIINEMHYGRNRFTTPKNHDAKLISLVEKWK